MTGPVFISYAHDSPLLAATVRKLADALLTRRFEVELDPYTLPFGGRSGSCSRRAAMRRAAAVIVVHSAAWRPRTDGTEAPGIGHGAVFGRGCCYRSMSSPELARRPDRPAPGRPRT